MRVGYLDSSTVLGVIFQEPGYERLTERIERHGRVFSSNLLEAEVSSALKREGMTGAKPTQILRKIDWVFPVRPLTREIGDVLSVGFLRGADLWHLACAMYLRGSHDSVELLSLDSRQIEVAGHLGLISG